MRSVGLDIPNKESAIMTLFLVEGNLTAAVGWQLSHNSGSPVLSSFTRVFVFITRRFWLICLDSNFLHHKIRDHRTETPGTIVLELDTDFEIFR